MTFFIKAFTFVWLASTFHVGAAEIKDPSTGIAFPSEISIEQGGKAYSLNATGVATRKKLFVSIYSVAHYLQSGPITADKLAAIFSDDKAKQLTMIWARDVEASKIKEGYKDSFSKALTTAQQQQLKAEVNQFIQLFTKDAKKGDSYILRWFPTGYIDVLINDKVVGSIHNVDFAKGLWSVWFGPKSVVEPASLMSLMK
jgi:hypothetical protein